jgi:hypothetical protein
MTLFRPRTQPATCHDSRARLLRIEEKLLPRARQLELQPRVHADLDALGNTDIIADRVLF